MTTVTNKLNRLTRNNNVSICYDTYLGRLHYNEWRQDLENNDAVYFGENNRSGVDYIVIGDMSKPHFNKSQLTRKVKQDLIELHEYYNGQYIDPEDWTKQDLIQDLLTVDKGLHYKAHYDETRWHDLDCDFTVTGYSQGDAVKVRILSDEYKWNTKEHLSNLFYDTPIGGSITYKGTEYYIDEYLDNQYVYWDKIEFINKFMSYYYADDKEEFIEFLGHFLPATLDYV